MRTMIHCQKSDGDDQALGHKRGKKTTTLKWVEKCSVSLHCYWCFRCDDPDVMVLLDEDRPH